MPATPYCIYKSNFSCWALHFTSMSKEVIGLEVKDTQI